MRKRGRLTVLGILLALASVATGAWGEGDGNEGRVNSVVFVAEIRGTINPASADFLKSSIRKAEKANAQALIVEMDTPGGLVSSTREMAQAMDDSSVPVVVYVTPAGASATSAGALLMLASHLGAMAPGTNVGAAHPVGPEGKDVEGAMGQKVLNDVKAFARGMAELRGRNIKLAEEVVSRSRSITAREAREEGMIELLATTRAELFQKLHGRVVTVKGQLRKIETEGTVVQSVEMSWGQKLLHHLAHPNIAAILMTLAMLLIYVEVSNPGITIAGVLGAICLLTAFIALQSLPVQIGGVALLILGMVLLVAELFVLTGGALAAGGLISFILGLLWALDPEKTDLRISREVLVAVSVGLGTGVGFLVWAAARTRRLTKEALGRIGGDGVKGLKGYVGEVKDVFSNGVSGTVLIRGELWNFSSSIAVKTGQKVEAVGTKGFTLTVKPAEASTDSKEEG